MKVELLRAHFLGIYLAKIDAWVMEYYHCPYNVTHNVVI